MIPRAQKHLKASAWDWAGLRAWRHEIKRWRIRVTTYRNPEDIEKDFVTIMKTRWRQNLSPNRPRRNKRSYHGIVKIVQNWSINRWIRDDTVWYQSSIVCNQIRSTNYVLFLRRARNFHDPRSIYRNWRFMMKFQRHHGDAEMSRTGMS